jgi:ribosome maturation factor RimP
VPRPPLQQRLISIVEPVCEAAGYELVELRFVLEQGGWTLRVAVDLPLDDHIDPHEVPSDRVDLQDCEDLSRELSAVLDVEDPIPQAFSLEVSSPGIDRPLRTAAHYLHFAGSEAKIQLAMPLRLEPPGTFSPSFNSSSSSSSSPAERRNFKGILQGVVDGKVVIECDGTTFQLPIDDIEHARLVPDWDLVMKGKSGVGTPLAKPIKPGHRPSQKRHRPDPAADPAAGPVVDQNRQNRQNRPDRSARSARPDRPARPADAANSDGPSTREPQLRPGPAASDAESKEQG